MAKGYDKHILRKNQVAGLGKELSRRAKSKCELCGIQAKLKVIELHPLPDEPSPDSAVLLCQSCQQLVDDKNKIKNPAKMQFLRDSVWSDVEPAQILAIRLTRKLSKMGESWAQSILDDLYIDPSVEHRL